MSATCYGGFRHHPRLGLCNSRIVCLSESGGGERWQVLKRVDEELSKGDERAALSLVKDLQGKPGGLRCFGAARQIPQRLYSLEELRLNGIETVSLLSPVDATLGSIERNLQIAALSGGVAAWNVLNLNPQQILYISLGLLFLLTFDSVAFNGGFGALILDTIGHTLSEKYHNRVTQHEAGHFLIAYLLGILPRGYTLTSLEALRRKDHLMFKLGQHLWTLSSSRKLYLNCVHPIGVYCKIFRIVFYFFRGCWTWVFGPPPNNPLSHLVLDLALHRPLPNNFTLANKAAHLLAREALSLSGYREWLDHPPMFLCNVNKGQVSATMLNRFSCIALAGVATEYLLFGCAEGGFTDINQVYTVTLHFHFPSDADFYTLPRIISSFGPVTIKSHPHLVRSQCGVYPVHILGAIRRGLPIVHPQAAGYPCTPSAHPMHKVPSLTPSRSGLLLSWVYPVHILKLRVTQCTPSAHPVHMAVGLSTAKPGVYTEKGRFSGEMGCTEHYTHSAPPRECPSKACRGNYRVYRVKSLPLSNEFQANTRPMNLPAKAHRDVNQPRFPITGRNAQVSRGIRSLASRPESSPLLPMQYDAM
nr:A_TM021B04.11 protein [Ipomoea batatas]